MINKEISNLMYYASAHLLLDSFDEIYVRNIILNLLKITDYVYVEPDIDFIEELNSPKEVLMPIVKYAVEQNIIKNENTNFFINKIMDILSKKPSSIVDTYNMQLSKNSEKASEWFFDYCIKNDSIKNVTNSVFWEAKDSKGNEKFEININEDIIPLTEYLNIRENYPKCNLCIQNEGSIINNKVNTRVLPIELQKDTNYFYFSQNQIINQHFYIVSEEHKSGVITQKTIKKMLDFVEIYNHFFVGSDTDLKDTARENYYHENFQGGLKALPLFKAAEIQNLSSDNLMIDFSIVDWFLNVIRIKGNDKKSITDKTIEIIEKWKNINNAENSVNILVRKEKSNKASKFVIDVILRNSKQIDEKFQNIKDNALSFIDAAGLINLPGKLINEIKEISYSLVTQAAIDDNIKQHKQMIEKIKHENNRKINEVEASIIIREEINYMCECILQNCRVFDNTEEGNKNFFEFLNSCNLKKK